MPSLSGITDILHYFPAKAFLADLLGELLLVLLLSSLPVARCVFFLNEANLIVFATFHVTHGCDERAV